MAILPSKAVVTILTVITAMVHFYLGINGGLSLDPSNGLNLLFVLNGLGYFYLVLAIFWAPDFLRGHSPYLRLFFIGYVLLTILLYFIINRAEAFSSSLGMFTKFIEMLLLIGLWRSRTSSEA
jgi:hypothetical protein